MLKTSLRMILGSLAMSALLSGCNSEPPGPPESDKLVFEARDAAGAGDKAKALELYGKSLELKPTAYAYFERGKLRAEMKDKAGAEDDCAKGLALEPENRDLVWLQGELKKPPGAQFTGANAEPPRSKK